ncbi:hypothetical protein BGW42_002514 [Actinomortierella wolfii]|nr:hypothetical protein BGW42_002514 [Actinomortierella wolfii]
MALAGLIWCVCCGTCAGRNMMRQAGLGRLVPPPFLQPSFSGPHASPRRSRRWKGYGEDVDDESELDEEALVGSASNSNFDGWWQRANEQTEQISMRVFGSSGGDEDTMEDDQEGYHSSVEYGYDLSDDEN